MINRPVPEPLDFLIAACFSPLGSSAGMQPGDECPVAELLAASDLSERNQLHVQGCAFCIRLRERVQGRSA